MKKILFPILTSVALVPTIAITSCGRYFPSRATIFDTDHLETNWSGSNNSKVEFIVDYSSYWDPEQTYQTNPTGVFEIRYHDEATTKAGFDLKDTHITFNKKTELVKDVDWSFVDESTHASIKITNPEVIGKLCDSVISIKTSWNVSSDMVGESFQFFAK